MIRIRTALLAISAITCIFYSCVTQNKLQQTKNRLSTEDSLLQSYSREVSRLDELRRKKEKLNQIDDTSNVRIEQFIEKTRSEIEQLHKSNVVLTVMWK